jgi:hypothetical protein
MASWKIRDALKLRYIQHTINIIEDEIVSTTEIIFLVEEAPEGGYTAQALDESIFTKADDLEVLKVMVKDAVNCHFDTPERCPKIIGLYMIFAA